MQKATSQWLSHLVADAKHDSSTRAKLLKRDFSRLKVPQELGNYKLNVGEGDKDSIKINGNSVTITLAPQKHISFDELKSVAGGGDIALKGVEFIGQQGQMGDFYIDTSVAVSGKDKNDGFSLVEQPDGSYLAIFTNVS